MWIICPKREQVQPNSSLAHGSPSVDSATFSVTSLASKADNTILQTCQVKIAGTTARCLLDSGAQGSFIESSLAKSLGLKPVGKRMLSISTFGGHTTSSELRNVYSLHLVSPLSPWTSLHVKLFEIDAIGHKNQRAPSSNELKKYPHLQGLRFNDLGQYRDLPVQILLGIDYYYKVIEGEPRKPECGSTIAPVAQNTIFGWVLWSDSTPLYGSHKYQPADFLGSCK